MLLHFASRIHPLLRTVIYMAFLGFLSLLGCPRNSPENSPAALDPAAARQTAGFPATVKLGDRDVELRSTSSPELRQLNRVAKALATAVSWGAKQDATVFTDWFQQPAPELSAPLPVIWVDPPGHPVPMTQDRSVSRRIWPSFKDGTLQILTLTTPEAKTARGLQAIDPERRSTPLPPLPDGRIIPTLDPCAPLPPAGRLPLGIVAALAELHHMAQYEPGKLRSELELMVPPQTQALLAQELGPIRLLMCRARGMAALAFTYQGESYAALAIQQRWSMGHTGEHYTFGHVTNEPPELMARSVMIEMLDSQKLRPGGMYDFANQALWEEVSVGLGDL